MNHLINIISNGQSADGSFPSYSSSALKKFKPEKKYHTIFATALIVSCLNDIQDNKKVYEIKKKAISYLLTQKSSLWTFNYWAKNSKEYKMLPYPDDLDDTFCALSALYNYDKSLIDGKVLAKITRLLEQQEIRIGGPYKTWVVPTISPKIWHDVDLVVNSNIAYFLTLQDIELPNLVNLIEKAIRNNNYFSAYYPSVLPVIYFISKWYRGKLKKKLIKSLLENPYLKNPLNSALYTTSLLNLGYPVEKFPQYSIKNIKPYAFCLDPKIEGKTYYAGSKALTAAFYVESLLKLRKLETTSKDSLQKDKTEKRISDQVIKDYRNRFSHMGSEIQKISELILQKLLQADSEKQIILLPYFTYKCLDPKHKISEYFLSQLGLANLYGWVAYTIYDDFLDEEGDPRFLSMANICLRELTLIFNTVLPARSGFPVFFQKIMDTIDETNTWETSSCRIRQRKIPNFGNYTQLAHKSLGHALGPAAIFFKLGYDKQSRELAFLMNFFKHYIIARQLNDDAHDWEKDLEKGQINAVGAMVLKNLKLEIGDLKIDVKTLQNTFWKDVVVDTCQLILKHCKLARSSLNKIVLIVNPKMFDTFISSIEKTAQNTLVEQKNAKDFIKTY